MSVDPNFVVGNKVTFNTYIPAIIGKEFKNVEVLSGSLAYKVAKLQNPLIDVWHSSGYSRLQAGVSRNPKDLTYIIVETLDKETHVLAYEWIDLGSVAIAGTRNFNVTIGNASAEKMEILRRVATIDLGLTFHYEE